MKHEPGPDCPSCGDKLKDGHEEIVRFFKWAKARSKDVHCSWVYRGPEDQQKAFDSGASKAKFGQSAHNSTPSKAIDLFQIDINNKGVFDPIFCARLNQAAKLEGFKLKWGGDFKSLGDAGHFELDQSTA